MQHKRISKCDVTTTKIKSSPIRKTREKTRSFFLYNNWTTLRCEHRRISQSIDQRQEDGTRRRWKRSIEERRKSVVTVRSSQVERTYSRADETADATSDAVSRVGKARERIQGWKCVSVTRLVSCLGWSPCVEPAWGGEKRGGWMEGGRGAWWRRKVERMNERGRTRVIGLNANTKLGWCNNRISFFSTGFDLLEEKLRETLFG